jgi:predicted nucleotidyltransferase
MINKLITSRARVSILKLLLLNPDNSYYLREIEQLVNLPVRAVQREIENLKRIGLAELRVQGNRRYYSVNRNFPIFEELKSILIKTVGLGDVLRKALEQSKDCVKLAFIYGSYAEQTENIASDIDLLVVGSISPKQLSTILASAKTDLRRELNFSVYTEKEFKQKIKARNHFLNNLIKSKKIYLIGDDAILKAIIS